MSVIDKVKVIVVGDSGVGKTSLVNLICQTEPTSNPGWTIGCSVEVKLHEYQAGTPGEKTYFVELWDVGGSTSHQNSRSIFYNPVHGVILVHDLTNRKSHQNLRKWLGEVLNKDVLSATNNGYDYDPEQFAGNQLPILVVGTKADMAENLRENVLSRKCSTVAEECGADEINLDCNNVKHLSPGSTNAVKISRFFDKVIERRYYSRDGGGQVNVKVKILNFQKKNTVFQTASYAAKPLKLCEAIAADETESIKLAVWGDQIDIIEEGKSYHITRVSIKTFDSVKSISVTKYSTIAELADIGFVKESTVKLTSVQEKEGDIVLAKVQTSVSCLSCSKEITALPKEDSAIVKCPFCSMKQKKAKLKSSVATKIAVGDDAKTTFTIFKEILIQFLETLSPPKTHLLEDGEELEDFLLQCRVKVHHTTRNVVMDMELLE